ncbi:hypothetical protein NDU88_004601 [Pleurodeles waltl]|uniref:Uncharacterized protein n=1 Tax=Pleurodeles waltl TaxID=8319 RepID=A0AAV7W5F7_PLEWA|nr:hypothetical protein NDU88_004601 [Pleurodeles waltl]
MEAGDAHDLSDCDSDRTMVEGSVVDSDFEEDELHVNRLIFINSSDAIPTAVHRGSEKATCHGLIQLFVLWKNIRSRLSWEYLLQADEVADDEACQKLRLELPHPLRLP